MTVVEHGTGKHGTMHARGLLLPGALGCSPGEPCAQWPQVTPTALAPGLISGEALGSQEALGVDPGGWAPAPNPASPSHHAPGSLKWLPFGAGICLRFSSSL